MNCIVRVFISPEHGALFDNLDTYGELEAFFLWGGKNKKNK